MLTLCIGCLPPSGYAGRIFCLHSWHPSRLWGQMAKHCKNKRTDWAFNYPAYSITSDKICSGWVHVGDVRWHWLDGWANWNWLDASSRTGQPFRILIRVMRTHDLTKKNNDKDKYKDNDRANWDWLDASSRTGQHLVSQVCQPTSKRLRVFWGARLVNNFPNMMLQWSSCCLQLLLQKLIYL